jgi:hypothetical protein
MSLKLHYHGTTVDRIKSILSNGTLPLGRIDTQLTGAWTTEILDNALQHSIERGTERGGVEPIVVVYLLPNDWINRYDDRKSVDRKGYDKNVHCFNRSLPHKYLVGYIHTKNYD